MGKGMPRKGVVLGLVAAGLFLTACNGDQDRIAALEKQVNRLQASNGQLLDDLDRAESKRRKAYSQLIWARDNVSILRDEVTSLRGTISELESAAESSYFDSTDTYDSTYDTYSDTYDSYDSYDSYGGGYDRDCSDYSYDNFDPGYGDPYGLDRDNDGIACEG
jgi:hypothetical protein